MCERCVRVWSHYWVQVMDEFIVFLAGKSYALQLTPSVEIVYTTIAGAGGHVPFETKVSPGCS